MKTVALLLMATVALLLVGCSDDSTVPVSPTDQSAMAPGSLGKNLIRPFTVEVGPTPNDPVISMGSKTWGPDGKIAVNGMLLRTFFHVSFPPDDPVPTNDPRYDLLTGAGVLEMNYMADPRTGVLSGWGKLTVDPVAAAAGDGVWEITWHGRGTFDPTFVVPPVLPTQMVGHGKGGVLTPMQLSADVTIIGGPPVAWGGAGEGVLKSH